MRYATEKLPFCADAKADHPVTLDANGAILSRFGDSTWDLSYAAGRRLTINFGDGPTRGAKLTKQNADALRRLTHFWMCGGTTAISVAARFQEVKKVFAWCSERAISFDTLNYRRDYIHELANVLKGATASRVVSAISEAWIERNKLGFYVLEPEAIRLLESRVAQRDSVQTPYIPPRIWTYQARRLKEFIDDYESHRAAIEACFEFCASAYQHNFDSRRLKSGKRLSCHQLPFHPINEGKCSTLGLVYHGRFRKTAERFGIAELLSKWVGFSDAAGIKSLSSYLNLTKCVGLAYILNFSLMRVSEGAALRRNCLRVYDDEALGPIYALHGITTKTLKDNDASWIVAPTVALAVSVMESVLRLQTVVASPSQGKDASDSQAHPLLQCWGNEPWMSGHLASMHAKPVRNYIDLIRDFPLLMDGDELTITEEDLRIATHMTPGLDPSRFSIGLCWPLSWHQLRRTGAVNMLASGMVSDQSLQYQLKHCDVSMSKYYSSGFSLRGVSWDRAASKAYEQEVFSAAACNASGIEADNLVSPHGKKRKLQVLNLVSAQSHVELIEASRQGKVSYRQTFLGACAKPGSPCPFGGISNVSNCIGGASGTPCEWALVDVTKRQLLAGLVDDLQERQSKCSLDSPLYRHNREELASARRAIQLIDNSRADDDKG